MPPPVAAQIALGPGDPAGGPHGVGHLGLVDVARNPDPPRPKNSRTACCCQERCRTSTARGKSGQSRFEFQQVGPVFFGIVEGIRELGQEHPQAPGGQQGFQAVAELRQFRRGQPPLVGEDLPQLGREAEIWGCRHRRLASGPHPWGRWAGKR